MVPREEVEDTKTDFSDEADTPTAGPLPKSAYTYQLEALTRRLLANELFEVVRDGNSMYMVFENTETGTHTYNLSEIVQYANLSHLALNEDDCKAYQTYVEDNSTDFRPLFEDLDSSGSVNRDKRGRPILHATPSPFAVKKYKDLNLAEMYAVNLYTQSHYKAINAFLRGTFHYSDVTPSWTKSTILHSVFCGSALSKIPDMNIDKVYRWEFWENTPVFKKREEAVKKKKVVPLSGFVSTSTSSERKIKLGEPMNVRWIFSQVRGKFIGGLSTIGSEQEFLMAPCCVKVTGSREQANTSMRVIEAAVVTDVETLTAGEKLSLDEWKPPAFDWPSRRQLLQDTKARAGESSKDIRNYLLREIEKLQRLDACKKEIKSQLSGSLRRLQDLSEMFRDIQDKLERPASSTVDITEVSQRLDTFIQTILGDIFISPVKKRIMKASSKTIFSRIFQRDVVSDRHIQSILTDYTSLHQAKDTTHAKPMASRLPEKVIVLEIEKYLQKELQRMRSGLVRIRFRAGDSKRKMDEFKKHLLTLENIRAAIMATPPLTDVDISSQLDTLSRGIEETSRIQRKRGFRSLLPTKRAKSAEKFRALQATMDMIKKAKDLKERLQQKKEAFAKADKKEQGASKP